MFLLYTPWKHEKTFGFSGVFAGGRGGGGVKMGTLVWNGQMKLFLQAIAQRCSVKKVFLDTSQNSQENTSASVSFLIKLQLGNF